jgi:hypothetical protein
MIKGSAGTTKWSNWRKHRNFSMKIALINDRLMRKVDKKLDVSRTLLCSESCKRVQKCWKHASEDIIFSDEKLTTNRTIGFIIYYLRKTQRERYQSLSRIIVSGAISKTGKVSLLFIESKVKIDKHH